MEYYIEILKSKKGHFWSRIKSGNRKIVWVSETYTTKQNAQIPVNNLIKCIGKRKCSLTFIDESKGK